MTNQVKIKHKANLSVSKKHFQQDGKWLVRPVKTIISICTCGNKYIKTREGQTVCIRCIARLSEKAR